MNEKKFKKWLSERKESMKEFYEKNKFWFGWFGAVVTLTACKRIDEKIHEKMYPGHGVGVYYNDEDAERPFKIAMFDHSEGDKRRSNWRVQNLDEELFDQFVAYAEDHQATHRMKKEQ